MKTTLFMIVFVGAVVFGYVYSQMLVFNHTADTIVGQSDYQKFRDSLKK